MSRLCHRRTDTGDAMTDTTASTTTKAQTTHKADKGRSRPGRDARRLAELERRVAELEKLLERR